MMVCSTMGIIKMIIERDYEFLIFPIAILIGGAYLFSIRPKEDERDKYDWEPPQYAKPMVIRPKQKTETHKGIAKRCKKHFNITLNPKIMDKFNEKEKYVADSTIFENSGATPTSADCREDPYEELPENYYQ